MAYVVQLENGTTHTLFDLKDLKGLVDPNLYDVIEQININQCKVDELEEDVKCLEHDLKGYDADLYALRGDCNESLDVIKEIIQYITKCKKINRNYILEQCLLAIKNIENSEGWY